MLRFGIVLLIIPTILLASGGERFCFYRSTDLDSVKIHVSDLLLPRDKVYKSERDHCLEIEMNQTRVPLIRAYIEKSFTLKQSTGRDLIPSRGNCQIELVREFTRKAKQDHFEVGQKTKINEDKEQKTEKTVSKILVGYDKKSSIRAHGEEYYFKCSPKGRSRYELSFYLESESSEISSVLEVMVGESVEVGNILKKVDEKKREINIKNGLVRDEEKGFEESRFYLTVQ